MSWFPQDRTYNYELRSLKYREEQIADEERRRGERLRQEKDRRHTTRAVMAEEKRQEEEIKQAKKSFAASRGADLIGGSLRYEMWMNHYNKKAPVPETHIDTEQTKLMYTSPPHRLW